MLPLSVDDAQTVPWTRWAGPLSVPTTLYFRAEAPPPAPRRPLPLWRHALLIAGAAWVGSLGGVLGTHWVLAALR